MNRRSLHILNMFVMKKEPFDVYCCWLFPILFTFEKRINISGYDTSEARIFGFLSEWFFNVWMEKQPFTTKEVPVIFFGIYKMEKENLEIFTKKVCLSC